MRINRVVIHSSPLITLFRAGLNPLLPELSPTIVVPDAVWVEVTTTSHDDPAALGLPRTEWAQRIAVPISSEVAIWNLGAGETAVLSFALQGRIFRKPVDSSSDAGND